MANSYILSTPRRDLPPATHFWEERAKPWPQVSDPALRRRRYEQRAKEQDDTLHEEDVEWMSLARMPAWLAEALRLSIDKMPFKLREAAVKAWHDAATGTDINRMLERLEKAVRALEKGGGLDALAHINIDATNEDIRAAAITMAHHGERHQCDATEWVYRLGVNTKLSGGRLARRIVDEQWWRKAIRDSIRRRRETAWLNVAKPNTLRWCSPDGVRERESIIEDTVKWAEKSEFVDLTTGKTFRAPMPSETARRQHAELLARASGIAYLSGDAPAYLATIDVPSCYHPTTQHGKNKRRRNKNYDGHSTPKDAMEEWFQPNWAKFRAAARKRKHELFWIMAVQPHKDGTPHAHIIFFERDIERVKKSLNRYFRAEEDQENGDEHRIDIKLLGEAEAGVKYAARAIGYITRAAKTQKSIEIDPGADGEAFNEDDQERIATAQWAATWRIRRFRTSHDAVTAWRLARRRDCAQGTYIKELAQENDYAGFLAAYKAGGGQLVRVPKKNRYDEFVLRTAGLEVDGVTYIPTSEWQIRRKQEQGTEVDISDFMAIHPECNDNTNLPEPAQTWEGYSYYNLPSVRVRARDAGAWAPANDHERKAGGWINGPPAANGGSDGNTQPWPRPLRGWKTPPPTAAWGKDRPPSAHHLSDSPGRGGEGCVGAPGDFPDILAPPRHCTRKTGTHERVYRGV